MERVPPEFLLDGYPTEIRALAERLRDAVREAVPDAIERVRPGWRLIGYDVPVGRRMAYFAYVAPEFEHVHLGFEHGVLMRDPDGLLEGAHLRLRRVRYLTFVPGARLARRRLVELTREAARVAALTRAERLALVLDRGARPDSG